MRFGYSFHGFLSDQKWENGLRVSTPDGNASYSSFILHEVQKRGWETFLMQKDRDREYIDKVGSCAFESFSQDKRWYAWANSKSSCDMINTFPELDILLVEWRWPIPGRNCKIDKSDTNYQSDLDRQEALLRHYYNTNTRIIIWDLDHKLTYEDEILWQPDAIFETSVIPKKLFSDRTRVEPPIIIDDLYQFKTVPHDIERKLVYVGSRYERDDVIEEWIKPVSDKFPDQIEFWGNWTKEPSLSECKEMWPNISYNKRITIEDFYEVYSTAVACPILAKRSYLETGFITPRPWEALMFGTIPIGLSSHLGIENYILRDLIAGDAEDMIDILEFMSKCDLKTRDDMRTENIEKLRFMDVSNFVDKIEEVMNVR